MNESTVSVIWQFGHVPKSYIGCNAAYFYLWSTLIIDRINLSHFHKVEMPEPHII